MKTEKYELEAEDLTLVKLAQEYADEDKARALLESIRWPKGPACPHCKFTEAYKLTPQNGSKTRKGLWCCGACRKQFTVTVGTVFEDSHLPISKWLMAMFILCSSKKSVSAHQLHRMLDITYKTAWFMAHRIRHAMGPVAGDFKKLCGTVEVDETYVGGKGDRKTRMSRKAPVVALIQRDGAVHTRVVPNVTQKNLKAAINECVDKTAIINTDDSGVYRGQLKTFADHRVVNHSAKEYAVKMPDGSKAHVNTAESFFSLLKRGVYGSWHHVSREHLPKYANEFAFRWTHRDTTDGDGSIYLTNPGFVKYTIPLEFGSVLISN